MSATGTVIGRPAGSLNDSAGWSSSAAAAKAGARGERDTARLLDALAALPGGPTVLHDLRIPIPGIKANIDHIVVSGRNVTIIDSKVWKPGFYWTLAGMTWRGRERFPHADKKTMPMALESIVGLLARERVRATVRKPLLVVWPSHFRLALTLMLLRSPGARAMTSDQFAAKVARAVGVQTANPQIVQELRNLVISIPSASRAPNTVPFGIDEL